MDTQIYYKYKENNVEIKGSLTCDRSVYKQYKNIIFKDTESISFKLLTEGNKDCQEFLESFMNFWNSDKCSFQYEYEERGKNLFELLKNKEIILFEVTMY